MLVMQVTSLMLTILPRIGDLVWKGAVWAWRRVRPGPAEKFAAVVQQVMSADPHILARKYCDRWLLK